MALTERLYINDNDAYTTYGLFALRGVFDQLLSFPKMKDRLSNNWGDQHGIDVDTTVAFTEAKDFSIDFMFAASTVSDYVVTRQLLMDLLSAPGTIKLTVSEINYEFFCLYIETSSYKRLTRSTTRPIRDRITLKFKMIDGRPSYNNNLPTARISTEGTYRVSGNKLRIITTKTI